ncbi:hypothetical protein [Edaphobacter sp.]|uniref:hypothetical protein n=1 Tax=Edaphobacter sp. TaxID=1934404 RepID=UPI002DBD480C|nr:hypothetical protein [Edaphobacter sp.]HEU5341960.1 hypothetical protein [Edaphobacter sp.]
MVQEDQAAARASAPTPEEVRRQLDLMVAAKAFRSSRRCVDFLRYVVDQTLAGAADNIKERTIGVEVFGRSPSYETSADHVVRTAAIDVRKRLALYYGDPRHQGEIRMTLVPGSYVPHFSYPPPEGVEEGLALPVADTPGQPSVAENPAVRLTEEHHVRSDSRQPRLGLLVLSGLLGAAAVLMIFWFGAWSRNRTADSLFWKPLLTGSGPVLIAAGDIPDGPPSVSTGSSQGAPVIQRGATTVVPFSDMVTVARVLNALQSRGQKVVIRPEVASSFSDFKQSPAVLIGAFNNEWSIRLTQSLRFSLALDSEKHLIYIRDAEHPESRAWSQVTGATIEQQQALRGGPALHDYALISRIRNPETGQVMVILGGLYAYGTAAAGEFLTDPELMKQLSKVSGLGSENTNLQIVLETDITDETPGMARVLVLSRTTSNTK